MHVSVDCVVSTVLTYTHSSRFSRGDVETQRHPLRVLRIKFENIDDRSSWGGAASAEQELRSLVEIIKEKFVRGLGRTCREPRVLGVSA